VVTVANAKSAEQALLDKLAQRRLSEIWATTWSSGRWRRRLTPSKPDSPLFKDVTASQNKYRSPFFSR